MLANIVKRLVAAVFKQQEIIYRALGDARCDRHAGQNVILPDRPSHHIVRMTVIGIVEHHDLVALGRCARQPQRRHHRFGTGVGKRHPLHSRQFANQLGGLTRLRWTRAEQQGIVGQVGQRLVNKSGVVAKQRNALAHGDIDVFIAIDIPDPGTMSLCPGDRIQHFLGGEAKSYRRTTVRKHRAKARSQFLRPSRARGVIRNQRLKVFALLLVQATRTDFQRREHAVRNHRRRGLGTRFCRFDRGWLGRSRSRSRNRSSGWGRDSRGGCPGTAQSHFAQELQLLGNHLIDRPRCGFDLSGQDGFKFATGRRRGVKAKCRWGSRRSENRLCCYGACAVLHHLILDNVGDQRIHRRQFLKELRNRNRDPVVCLDRALHLHQYQ